MHIMPARFVSSNHTRTSQLCFTHANPTALSVCSHTRSPGECNICGFVSEMHRHESTVAFRWGCGTDYLAQIITIN